MARPKKQAVDYFPHSCDHGQTMFILEQRYGNDGYALWFKTLEFLGKTEGHYLDFNKPATWLYFLSKVRLSAEIAIEVLNLLADLEAIDPELWAFKIIWSANFIKGIAPVYLNRRAEIPAKPSFYTENPEPTNDPTVDNPQSRVEESRVEKSFATPPPPPGGNGDARPSSKNTFSCECFDVTQDFFIELTDAFPLLPPEHISSQFSNMRDWCLDNRRLPKHSKKFLATGKLKSPRRFIKNWLSREDPIKIVPSMHPHGQSSVVLDIPPEVLIFDPNCPTCGGDPFKTMGKCECAKTKGEIDAERQRQTTAPPK